MPADSPTPRPAGASVITGATFLEAQRQANELALSNHDEQLAAAGIEPAAAHREAAIVAATYTAYGVLDRAAVTAAFLSGLELGARCARLVP
jgi:hypothetical protein